MPHSCRKMKNLLKEAEDKYNCIIKLTKKGVYKVYKPDSDEVRTFHLGNKGYYPLKRMLRSIDIIV